ncbi:hypothetical protein Zm00014a_025261 [Zea mays]|uniref:Uncharacterized protein n=1 Tax=Zea mays TaxID=4577 RepID=A0A3L6FRP6_MAIZE|nr:hypothetical protein Zm00014a_025261 [Zea mays]
MALPPMPAALGGIRARSTMPTGANPTAAVAASSSAPGKSPKKAELLGATGTGRGGTMGGGAGGAEAGFSLTAPALTKNSSRVISPSVDWRWGGWCPPPSAPCGGSSRTRFLHASSTVLVLSMRGSVSDDPCRCIGVGGIPALAPAIEAEALAWVSSAVQMLRSSSSMFTEPKPLGMPRLPPQLAAAPPRVLWDLSNVNE